MAQINRDGEYTLQIPGFPVALKNEVQSKLILERNTGKRNPSLKELTVELYRQYLNNGRRL
jgi:hypothetical protein